MDVLVTGGAGYIGSDLVEKLNASEGVKKIYVLDNLSRSPLSFFIGCQKLEKVTFIRGDILDSYVLSKVLKKVEIVFHLAGYVSFPYSYAQNVQYEQINQWGTLNIVRCIQQMDHIKRFVYLSSASVYGLRGQVDLRDNPNPTNAYGKSKLEGEKFVNLLENQCQVSIVRSANVFGFNPSFRMDSVLNNFIFHALVDKKIIIYGNGTQKRPFVSLQKVVEELLLTLSTQEHIRKGFAVEFNADLNEIKDWLIQRHLPDLEYTYLNPSIEYEEQSIKGLNSLEEELSQLDEVFMDFRTNLRVQK